MRFTRASLRKFCRIHKDHLYVQQLAHFDGMTDCVERRQDTFRKVESINFSDEHKMGISGVWLVGRGRDYFKPFSDGFAFCGVECFNSCGSFVLAIPFVNCVNPVKG